MRKGLIATLTLILIATGSVIQFSALNRFFLWCPGIDKVLHAGAWFLVTVLLYAWGRPIVEVFYIRVRLLIVVSGILVFSMALESAQSLVVGRSFESGDVLANFAGIILGAVLMERLKLRASALFLTALFSGLTVAMLVVETRNDYGHYFKGLSYQHQKQYRLAKEQFLLALEEGKKTAALYNDLAWLNLELLGEDTEAALSYANVSVEMEPNNPDFIGTYGYALLKMGKFDEALNNLRKSYEFNQDTYCINYQLGLAYFNVGQLEDALYHLQRQKKLTPGDYYDHLSDQLIKLIKNEKLS